MRMVTERAPTRSPRRHRGLATAAAALTPLAVGCAGVTDPRSPDASAIALSFVVMMAIAVPVFLLVVIALGAALWRARGRAVRPIGEEPERLLVFGAGILLPVSVMVVLMVLSVLVARQVTEAGDAAAVEIEVIGHQWWWEVRYRNPDFTTANEIHIPVGRRVEITLHSEDVIHSFWVPQLAGKVDLVPGRVNRLVFEADEPGIYEGQCAEFCGLQHANMRFLVVADPVAEFTAWQARQQRESAVGPDSTEQVLAGRQVFLQAGCAACHTVRGTEASGTLGPDLTHLAGRRQIASGVLPNGRGSLGGWIVSPQSIKPGTQMPPTELDPDQLQALLAYLERLD